MDNNNLKSVINLSTYKLNEHHITLLSRGLKFCPTPGPPNPGEMRQDMDRVHRRLRQVAFFDNPEFASPSFSDNVSSDPSIQPNLFSQQPFKHKKFKMPVGGRGPPSPQILEAMISCNEYMFDLRPTFFRNSVSNLSPAERLALKDLRNNKDIIIRIADKGAAVVIQNRLDYLKEGYRQLSDPKFYQKLDHNPTAKYKAEVNTMVEDLYQNGEIDITVRDYLTVTACRTPQFYTIPKIHKSPLKGRPIVSGNDGPTEKISQFVDHFLNPPTTMLKSFVKDTTHLLQILNNLGNIPDNTLLATLDVTSLYTNINNTEGLAAAEATLNHFRPGTNLKPSNNSLLKLLEMVLTRTNFQFNGQNYLQISGTCMGTKVAPSYAINTMGQFEDKHVYTYHKQCLLYLRYIDDILVLWTHGKQALLDFVEHLNTRTDHFKFTTEISDTQVAFLDTMIRITDNKITTDLYCKPTDSHNYLYYDSSHPKRCKDSIPYSQFLRIRRICSDIRDFDTHVLTFSSYFLKRNYPLDLITEAALTVREIDRDSLLSPKPIKEDTNDRIFLITTYHPYDRSLQDIFYKNWEMLGRSPTTDFIHQRKLMCGYRRPKNLRDLLVQAKVPYQKGDELADPTHHSTQHNSELPQTVTSTAPNVPPKQRSILDFFRRSTNQVTPSTSNQPTANTSRQGTNPKQRGFNFCNNNKCRYCPLLNKTGKITSHSTKLEHNCMTNISCRSSNLIYAITCKVCGIQYVGQTSLRIKDRFVHHFRDIALSNQDKTVGRHFSDTNHRGLLDINISVLEFIKAPPQSPKAILIRNRIERFWTHQLRTLAPLGLNMEHPKEYSSSKK